MTSFDYVVNESASWPPRMRPKPPFGPTMIEVLRSCPLRSCFEISPGYERRMGVAARIGIALHSTIQAIAESPFASKSLEEIAAETSEKFASELNVQHVRASERPREQSLPWDDHRTEQAIQAAIAECIRLAQSGYSFEAPRLNIANNATMQDSRVNNQSPPVLSSENSIALEVPVSSADGLFKGRVDRAERIPEGIRLIDYKSAAREDLPERYERQLQLYAFMWHDTYGDWPFEAQVYYPLRGVFFSVDITPETCKQVAEEARTLIGQLSKEGSIAQLATPGDVCKACEFRPWCRPFWASQASEKKHMRALEAAAMGFEGSIESITLSNHYWRMFIAWRNAKVKLVAPQERFPHLSTARVGQSLRILNAPLRGQLYEPNALINEYSEIFLLNQ